MNGVVEPLRLGELIALPAAAVHGDRHLELGHAETTERIAVLVADDLRRIPGELGDELERRRRRAHRRPSGSGGWRRPPSPAGS